MFHSSGLSSSDSDDELHSPSYANFLQYDHKPIYSDVVKKQMVGSCIMGVSMGVVHQKLVC